MAVKEIEAHVLDLLIDGDSSFAALLWALRRHWRHTETTVDDLLGILRHLQAQRLVHASLIDADGRARVPTARNIEMAADAYRAWFPHATQDEVAVDEIGLWYTLSDQGRAAWSQHFGNDRRDPWALDVDADRRTLEVRANRRDVAEAVLLKWLSDHRDIQEVPGSRETVDLPEFVMRDGTRAHAAVLVRCRYELRHNQ